MVIEKAENRAVSPLIRVFEQSVVSGSFRDLRNFLSLGQSFEGRVIDILPGEGVLLQLADQVILAKTEVPLAKGLTAEFQVQAIEPQIVLRLVNQNATEEWQKNILKDFLILRGSTDSILQEVTGCLCKTQDSEGNSAQAAAIEKVWKEMLLGPNPGPSIWKTMGLDWEAKLKRHFANGLAPDASRLIDSDLKGLIMRALSASSEVSKDQGASAVLSTLLRLVEGYQAASLMLSSKAHTAYFLPLWFSEAAGWGECELFLGDKGDPDSELGGRSDTPWQALFFLKMTDLGPIRISLQVLGKQLNCMFFVGDEKRKDSLVSGLAELETALSSQGFAVASMKCVPMEKTVLEDSSDWFNILKEQGQHLLNVII